MTDAVTDPISSVHLQHIGLNLDIKVNGSGAATNGTSVPAGPYLTCPFMHVHLISLHSCLSFGVYSRYFGDEGAVIQKTRKVVIG